MALYAIGDIQGCYCCLQRLLDTIHFDPTSDQLWFVGDLVNRGPDSLGTLRFIKSLGASAISVLGNHDLHLIASAYGIGKIHSRDTIQSILDAPDCADLINWLRNRPLMHAEQNYCLVHAGLAPQWTIDEARKLAHEVEYVLNSNDIVHFLAHMHGNQPDTWNNQLKGWDRLRFITNAFTRIRYCSVDGALQMKNKQSPEKTTNGLVPWFQLNNQRSQSTTIIFGHWSTLGLQLNAQYIALDTGCVWGGHLTAVCLGDHRQVFQVRCGASA